MCGGGVFVGGPVCVWGGGLSVFWGGVKEGMLCVYVSVHVTHQLRQCCVFSFSYERQVGAF